MTPEQILKRWEELLADHEAAKRLLEQLEADEAKPPFWNLVYPVNIDLPLLDSGVAIGTFTIDEGITFFVKGLEANYNVTGSITEGEDTSAASLTIPESLRPQIFDYTWMLRDNGTGRDWGNLPIPSAALRSGNVSGMWFGFDQGIGTPVTGQARMRGGTVGTVTINPIYFNADSEATGLSDFTSHYLQVIVSGIAVRDGVLP